MKKFVLPLCIFVLAQAYNCAPAPAALPVKAAARATAPAPSLLFYTYNEAPSLFDFVSDGVPEPTNLPTADTFC